MLFLICGRMLETGASALAHDRRGRSSDVVLTLRLPMVIELMRVLNNEPIFFIFAWSGI